MWSWPMEETRQYQEKGKQCHNKTDIGSEFLAKQQWRQQKVVDEETQEEGEKPPPNVPHLIPMKRCLRDGGSTQVEDGDGQQKKQQPHHHVDGILR